uniref:Uncharacterized protein n=1 Tax=Micrurus lemniscatus lemniscatus TaxID=129467 RepID=A0A2D4HH00_MICLE
MPAPHTPSAISVLSPLDLAQPPRCPEPSPETARSRQIKRGDNSKCRQPHTPPIVSVPSPLSFVRPQLFQADLEMARSGQSRRSSSSNAGKPHAEQQQAGGGGMK